MAQRAAGHTITQRPPHPFSRRHQHSSSDSYPSLSPPRRKHRHHGRDSSPKSSRHKQHRRARDSCLSSSSSPRCKRHRRVRDSSLSSSSSPRRRRVTVTAPCHQRACPVTQRLLATSSTEDDTTEAVSHRKHQFRVLLPSPAAYNATSNGVSMFHLINYYFP